MNIVPPRLLRQSAHLLRAAALALLMLAPATAALAAAPLQAGVDYIAIPGGEPFEARPGRIEVVEAFGYTCQHCANFEPRLAAWKAKLPADVDLVPLPAPFGGHWIPYAQAYYAAQAQGLAERTHGAVFRALHQERSLPLSRATPEELATFYAGYGADPRRFVHDMTSPATEAKLAQVRAFLRRSLVEGTPTLVVNGRYLVRGRDAADTLRITDALIVRERAAAR